MITNLIMDVMNNYLFLSSKVVYLEQWNCWNSLNMKFPYFEI